jgi:hypothetical protein
VGEGGGTLAGRGGKRVAPPTTPSTVVGVPGAPTARQVHVIPAEGAEVRVPRDVAELLDDDAQLEVGPERVVTLRPRQLRTASLAKAATVAPLDDARRLRPARGALTQHEREALAEFLGG